MREPQRAVRRVFYRTEQTGFFNGDVRLSATLVVPNGPGPHPAVVMIHGSGPATRDALRPWADMYARRGIAASAGLEIALPNATVGGGAIFGNGLGNRTSVGEYAVASIAGYRSPGIQVPSHAVSLRIEKTPGKNVYVMGHTDPSGTDEYNIALSERRAQTVADYLARLGIDPARLQVVPKGETEPTGLGDDKDRRVEFQWR